MNFIQKIFNGKKKEKPKTLKEMFDAGLFSEKEFLRFNITQKEIGLEKAKKELVEFLKKHKK